MKPLVIIGPTASGKSSLAMELASRVPGTELLSADSKAVYRGMDIGTAKPSPQERAKVPHHGIDLVGPGDEFTVSHYQKAVDQVVGAVGDKPLIIVGGTGLYVRALIDSFEMPDQFPEVRERIETEPDTQAIWLQLNGLDPVAAAKMEPTNRRRIVRALEVTLGSGRKFSSYGPGVDAYPPIDYVQVGLEIDRELLNARIDARYDTQMEAGLLDEVIRVSSEPMSRTAAAALGYRELIAHLNGETSLDEALEEAKFRTRRFSRKQQRWFRRDPRITWIDVTDPDLADKALELWTQG